MRHSKYEKKFFRRKRDGKTNRHVDGTIVETRIPLPLGANWVDKTKRGSGKSRPKVWNPPLPCENLELAKRIKYGVMKNRGLW